MLLTQNYRSRASFQQRPLNHQQPQPLLSQPRLFDPSVNAQTSPLYAASELDLDLDVNSQSLSSSPASQFSGIQGTAATFDRIPTVAVPRGIQQTPVLDFSAVWSASDEPSFFASADMMNADPWLQAAQLTPKSAVRMSHHRESSLSSLGSTGPASPYSHNTANPQIAITDSTGDGFHVLGNGDEFHYQLAKSFPATQDAFYAQYPNYAPADATANATYANMAAAQRQKPERSLLPAPDFPGTHSRSRPVSVASSVASDSPATPAGEPEDDKRRKTGLTTVPKLDRTMTDIYSDELYSPSFTFTSASPSQVPTSPSNELFAQRLQAANSQHLSTSHSPSTISSGGRSPFRHGSPFAPMPTHELSQMGLKTAQELQEQRLRDAQVQQQMGGSDASTGTPQTISPKDAILEYHSPEGEANFPLFPPQESAGFDAASLKAATQSQVFDGLQLDDTSSFAAYNQLPVNIQVPQQYPFIAQPRQQPSTMSNASMDSSRLGSAESANVDAGRNTNDSARRPAGTRADGGTYTCTYHGCTLRFETPALLQKHKREGHRQANGLTGPRRPEQPSANGMTSALLNSQAGPHKCDRVNPSTGKPCNTVFSRPYDLTRHEDTIHNARKQKVRCNMCTDDKSFSRADALTRHYRVCHPDVEFPGKHRRRGGQGA